MRCRSSTEVSMTETQLSLARMEQFQSAWQTFIDRAALEAVPSCPATPEDRLRSDIRNRAIWLKNAAEQYDRIPFAERY